MLYVFYGPEGSGKSTQAKKLAQAFAMSYISTGDMIRYFAKEDKGKIGQACRAILNNGTYLSDKLTFDILTKKLKKIDLSKDLVLDGFPRNLTQTKFLIDLCQKLKLKIAAVIYLWTDKQTAIKRVMARHRDNHDSLIKLESRLCQYYQYELTTVGFCRAQGILHKIDGTSSIQAVSAKINRIVFKFKN